MTGLVPAGNWMGMKNAPGEGKVAVTDSREVVDRQDWASLPIASMREKI